MSEALFALVLEKYAQLSVLLLDLMTACTMEKSEEQKQLINSIKQRTNHNGIHMTEDELAQLFLGRSL